MQRMAFALGLYFCLAAHIVWGQEAEFPQSSTRGWFSPDGWKGTLVVVGGGAVPTRVADVLRNELSDKASIVVINAAAADPAASFASAEKWLTGLFDGSVVNPSEEPGSPASPAALADAIRRADAVWICGGSQERIAKAYVGTEVETELRRLLSRSNSLVAGTSAGAAIMSKRMIAGGNPTPEIAHGFDFIPNAIIDQHFTQRNRQERLKVAISQSPAHFGIGIDEGTAAVIRGRDLQCIGTGNIHCYLANSPDRGDDSFSLKHTERADLTQLRRAAIERTKAAENNVRTFGYPQVAPGSLVIVGGGGMPASVVERFVSLAGGEQAHIVYLPTAVPREEALRAEAPAFLRRARVASLEVLPQMTEKEISAERFQEVMKRATGVWFSGGRQWNFIDAYDGTAATELFHDVLRRGGVIGGSSAGATIQGEYLVRGHPLGNQVMMAEGYERGLGFLPGTAIDQHFSQRNRFKDLVPVVERFPQLLGIGIDEATALVVTGTHAEVIGQNAVHFLPGPLFNASTEDQAHRGQTGSDSVTKHSAYRTVVSGETIDLSEFVGESR